MVPLQELFGARGTDFHGGWALRYYDTAWTLIHYILNGDKGAHRARFGALSAALVDPTLGPQRSMAALERAFPAVAVSALEDRVRWHANAVANKRSVTAMGARFKPRPRTPLVITDVPPEFVERTRRALAAYKQPDRI